MTNNLDNLLDLSDAAYEVRTKAPNRSGALPFTEKMLKESPSGDLFGWSHNVGMGWRPDPVSYTHLTLPTKA